MDGSVRGVRWLNSREWECAVHSVVVPPKESDFKVEVLMRSSSMSFSLPVKMTSRWETGHQPDKHMPDGPWRLAGGGQRQARRQERVES
jgi:hypothetical protein